MPFKLITDQQSDCASMHDRALHYGDGLFETLLLDHGDIRFWPLHYQRLQRSAKRLDISCPDLGLFDHVLAPYREIQQKQVLKIILSRGEGGRGLSMPDNPESLVYILKYPYKNYYNQPVKVYISSILLPENPALAGIKHLNRLNYVLATQELSKRPEMDEAILCDQRQHVTESIVHNLFFVDASNQICTPMLDLAGVEGVMRESILLALKQMQKTVRIGRFTVDDLLQAKECFLCNSVQGIRRIESIEDRSYQSGPLTTELQDYFNGQS